LLARIADSLTVGKSLVYVIKNTEELGKIIAKKERC